MAAHGAVASRGAVLRGLRAGLCLGAATLHRRRARSAVRPGGGARLNARGVSLVGAAWVGRGGHWRVVGVVETNIERLGQLATSTASSQIDCNVISHHMQRFAVWFGGSMLSSTVRRRRPHPRVVCFDATFFVLLLLLLLLLLSSSFLHRVAVARKRVRAARAPPQRVAVFAPPSSPLATRHPPRASRRGVALARSPPSASERRVQRVAAWRCAGSGASERRAAAGVGCDSRGALRAQRLRRVVLPFIRHTLTWFGVRPPAAVARLLAPPSRSLSCRAGAAVSWRRPRRRGGWRGGAGGAGRVLPRVPHQGAVRRRGAADRAAQRRLLRADVSATTRLALVVGARRAIYQPQGGGGGRGRRGGDERRPIEIRGPPRADAPSGRCHDECAEAGHLKAARGARAPNLAPSVRSLEASVSGRAQSAPPPRATAVTASDFSRRVFQGGADSQPRPVVVATDGRGRSSEGRFGSDELPNSGAVVASAGPANVPATQARAARQPRRPTALHRSPRISPAPTTRSTAGGARLSVVDCAALPCFFSSSIKKEASRKLPPSPESRAAVAKRRTPNGRACECLARGLGHGANGPVFLCAIPTMRALALRAR